MRYKAVCQNKECEWQGTIYSYLTLKIVQEFAEMHMMRTGHIVNIVEYEFYQKYQEIP